MSEHDWYASTVRTDPHWLAADMAARWGGEVVRAKGLHGYAESVAVMAGGETQARVLYGGRNGAPHVFASGNRAPQLVRYMRDVFPENHAVTRFDAAEDFDGPGSWDRLYAACLALADERGLVVNIAGDYHRAIDGRTLYIGSRKSAVFARLYEKGRKEAGQNPDGPPVSPDWVRLELVVRPEGAARMHAARCHPDEGFGYSDWSRELAARLLLVDVDRVHIKEVRQSDDERALGALVRQYAGVAGRLAGQRGSWSVLMLELERKLKRELLAREDS